MSDDLFEGELDRWPRLTQELKGPREPGRCQACGADDQGEHDLLRWQECDDEDQPEPRIVVLCRPCGDRLIEPHPRLYRQVDEWGPWPGCMDLCCGCRFREGVACRHPDLKANGGLGLALTMPQPMVGFIDGHDSQGRRWGRRYTQWRGPVSGCAGREEARGPE